MPEVIAVCPLHNHARWVAEALDSLAAQTVRPSRVVVVDDGSTDGGGALVRELSGASGPGPLWHGCYKGLPLSLLRSESPRGPSWARNQGLRLGAGAELFALLDTDDVYAPTKIEKSLRAYSLAPARTGIIYSDYETLNASTGLRLRLYKPAFSAELLARECIVNCDSLVTRRAFELAGPFDESLRVVEDLDRWWAITKHLSAVHVPEALVTVRTGTHSATAGVGKAVWEDCYARARRKHF